MTFSAGFFPAGVFSLLLPDRKDILEILNVQTALVRKTLL